MKVTISKSRKIGLFLVIVTIMVLVWFFAVKPIKQHPLARRIMTAASQSGFSPDASLAQYYSLTNELTGFKSLRRFGIAGTLNHATKKRQKTDFYAKKYYPFGTLDAVFRKSGDMLYLQEYAKKGVTPRGDIVKKVTDDIYLVTDRR